MRAFISALLLFALLISAVVINSIYINSACDNLGYLAEKLAAAQDREPLIKEIKEIWNKNLPYFNLSIRTNELERMNDLIESLDASHKAQNEAEFQKYCILIADLAEEFACYERLSLRSVF